MIQEVVQDAALRATPPLGVSLLGITIQLPAVVYGLTIIYILCQLVVIAPKVYRTILRKKEANDEDNG